MSTKRILTLLLAVIMMAIPMMSVTMTALADEAELGSYDNPWQLSTTSVRFAVYVEPESEAWVQVDDCNGSILTAGYATSADYMVVYCRQTYYPETESGDNTMTLTMVDGVDMFCVCNTGTEGVTVYMALSVGTGAGVSDGTVDHPENVTLARDWFGNLAADLYVDLTAGSQGYYYSCIAPDDGAIAVSVGAVDEEYNSVGWIFNVNNLTAYRYGDYHFSDDDPFCNYEIVKVSKGDELQVFVNTYDPEDMWNSPAATVNTQFTFYTVGTYEFPEEAVLGTNEANIEADSFGYYYTWTATESGYLTVSMLDENWTYNLFIERASGDYDYGDTHYSDDDIVAPSETVEVYAGDKVTISVCTYAPGEWVTPAGVVTWELAFEAAELEEPVIPDTPLGAYDNPYELYANGSNLGVYIEPGDEAWVWVDDSNGSVVTVGYATTSAYMLVYCRQAYYPETESGNNTLTVTMVNGADMFSIYNSGEEAVTVYLALTEGEGGDESCGTWDNPEEVTLEADFFGGLNASVATQLEQGNEGYYYILNVLSDGLLTVGANAIDSDYNFIGWSYFISIERADGTYYYGDTHWSDDEVVVYYDKVNVFAGDVVTVFVATYDPELMWTNPAGTVMVDFSLEAVGTWGNPDSNVELGQQETVLDSGNNGYYYEWTATESGTLVITVNGSGWQYNVNASFANGSFYYGDNHYFDDENMVNVESIKVTAGDVITIMIGTYDAETPWMAPAGIVSWSMELTASEETGEKQDGYVETGIALEVGDAEYLLSDMYLYTVYCFEPTETGKYVFTSSNGLIALVSTNGMWVTIEPSAETVNASTFTWECTSVGQSILIAAIADSETVSITVELKDTEIVEIPVENYENVATPEDFTADFDAELLQYVDTFDDVCDTAVLGSDGFYHLNSANGPILYVDLDDALMNLVDAMAYGQLRYSIIVDGVVVGKVDFNDAFAAYVACADQDTMLYPLTADLMEIYKRLGEYKLWYGEDGWIGGDLEDCWMFACYYMEGEGEPEYQFGDVNGDGKVNTADYVVLKRHIMKTYELSEEQLTRANINGDDKINTADYVLLKRFIMGTWKPE